MTAEPGAGFDSIFAREIAPFIEEKETERRDLWRSAWRRAIPTFTFAAAFLIAALARTPSDGLSTAFVMSSMVIAASAIRFLDPLSKWRDKLTAELSSLAFARFGFHWSAETPSGFLAPLERVGLLPRHDRYKLCDHVTGSIGSIEVELTEAIFQKRVSGNKRSSIQLVFRGLLARYDFPKRFSGKTVVRRNFNAFEPARGTPGFAGERVHLESVKFEDAFDVFSTDQIEARYLLTPAFMERLLHLETHTYGLQAAFVDGHLWLALDVRRNVFAQPSIFFDLTANRDIELLLMDIRMIGEIAEILNLETETRV